MVYSLVYVSTLTAPLTTESLRNLLFHCRTANVRAGITGLLLHRSGTFLHVLEGDRDAVEALFDKIKVDPRHQKVTVVRSREQQHRQFPDWSTGFGDVSAGPGHVDVSTGPGGPTAQTDAETEYIQELQDLFDR